MSRKKDNNIQIARAVAIIMVTMMHTLPFDMDVQWTILVKILTNSCVAIFVFLSGYLTDINDINIRTIR